jgi:PAS domain S-box-containing protein
MTVSHSSLSDRQLLSASPGGNSDGAALSGILQKIVQNAGALLEVQNCSLALADITGSVLVTRAALQKHGQQPRHSRFQLNEGVAGWVAEHRSPLLINDVSGDARFKRLGRHPVGSMMCAPLIDEERVIGTLTASSPETNAFSERQLQMLAICAEQAALAITNARNADLARRQASQLEMLLDLSQGITTRLDALSLYRAILTDLRRLIPCTLSTIYQYDAAAQELLPVAELNEGDPAVDCEEEGCSLVIATEQMQSERISLHSEESAAAWAAAHRHPMLRPPARASESGQCEETVGLPDMAQLGAPLVSKNILYGVIALRRPAPFTSEELRLLRNLSTMAAAALENVELFDRVRTEQEQLSAIVAASSDGIALVGFNGRFIEANPAFGRIFALEAEQVAGMECLELFGCEQVEDNDDGRMCRELCIIQEAFQLEQAMPYREVDLLINGASRCIGLSITPLIAMKQSLCLVMARDVTAIRDATRMKANFLSMITHELRSPLNAINGYLDLALTGIAGELNEQQREFMQRARSSSEYLYALVEDLLLVARADSGQVRLNPAITSLQEMAANAIEELELMAIDSKINVEVDISHDFPPIYADPVRLQQVLRNLISNALRFTPSGGQVTVAASIAASPQGEDTPLSPDEEVRRWLQLQVRDTGYGIAAEHIERIFDRFYQAPQPGAIRVGGQGLGLAIVKMIVELHGGQVSVESVPGHGSTFTCLLPCVLS